MSPRESSTTKLSPSSFHDFIVLIILAVAPSPFGIISFEKDGYQRKTASIPKSFNGVAIINLFSIVSWAVDFATGAINKFDMKGIDVKMQKEE